MPARRGLAQVLRILLAVVLITLDTLLFGGPALLLSITDRSGRLPHRIARHWGAFVLRICGVRIVVEGTENVPGGSAVYAVNHSSALDIPILFGHLPVSFRIIYKKSLAALPLLGWYLFLAGHVSIDRGNPFKAKRSLAAAAERIRRGTDVVAFPEGTRSHHGELRPFKRGTFLLAIDAGVPVVPVSIVGVKRVAPRGIKTLRPGVVAVRIHPPIPTAGRGPGEAEVLAEEVRGVVARGCEAPPC